MAKGATKNRQETKQEQEIQKEKQYKVLLHNDDTTTMEFVVCVLMGIFEHNEKDAECIMMNVHHVGVGIAGIYPVKVAQEKVRQVYLVSANRGFSLQCSMELE